MKGEKPKILIYTTPTCVFCKSVKEYLDDKGLEYELIDLSLQRDKIQEMVDKSGQMGVPVIDIDGEIIIGFDKPRLDAVLKK